MIIIMKPSASQKDVQNITRLIESKGLTAHLSEGTQVTIVGVVGDKSRLAGINLEISQGVDKVVPVTESYKLVNRKFHPENSSVSVGSAVIGPDTLTIMAGPCAIESQQQLIDTAFAVKKAGATILRGGAYKPRTCLLYTSCLGLFHLCSQASVVPNKGLKYFLAFSQIILGIASAVSRHGSHNSRAGLIPHRTSLRFLHQPFFQKAV